MHYIIASLNVILIGWLTWWMSKRVAKGQEAVFRSALIFRLVAGVLLGVIYFYYYGVGDTIGFFQDAVRLKAIALSDPGSFFHSLLSDTSPIELVNQEPRSFFFTVLLTFVNVLTDDNYWISSLWFSLFSFCGAWYFVRRISDVMPSLQIPSIVAFLFWPSVVFWSAGIVKESVAFGSLCFLAGVFITLVKNRRLNAGEYVLIAVALWLLLGLKYYWAAVFIPSAVTCLVIHWLLAKRITAGWQLMAAWVVLFALFALAASFTHPNLRLDAFLEVIRTNYDGFVAISRPDNVIVFPNAVHNWGDMVVNAPWALFSGLFRPLPFEPGSITGHISSIENFLLIVLTAMAAVQAWRTGVTERLLLVTTLTYVFLLCIFLALSTPNFGTLSRYRIGFLPFFVMLVLSNNILLKNWLLRRTGQISTFTK